MNVAGVFIYLSRCCVCSSRIFYLRQHSWAPFCRAYEVVRHTFEAPETRQDQQIRLLAWCQHVASPRLSSITLNDFVADDAHGARARAVPHANWQDQAPGSSALAGHCCGVHSRRLHDCSSLRPHRCVPSAAAAVTAQRMGFLQLPHNYIAITCVPPPPRVLSLCAPP